MHLCLVKFYTGHTAVVLE